MARAQYFDLIGDTRADRGAMMAMEMIHQGDPATPNPELIKAIVAEAYKQGLVILSCGVRGNVFRFLPALTIPDSLIHEGLDIFERCVAKVTQDSIAV